MNIPKLPKVPIVVEKMGDPAFDRSADLFAAIGRAVDDFNESVEGLSSEQRLLAYYSLSKLGHGLEQMGSVLTRRVPNAVEVMSAMLENLKRQEACEKYAEPADEPAAPAPSAERC